MIRPTLLTILLCSCGGAPFETSLLEQTPPVIDAGTEDAQPLRTVPDADTPASEVSTPEASTCIPSAPYLCNTEQPAAKPFTEYCLATHSTPGIYQTGVVVTTTPVQCQTCEKYNCACVGPAVGCPCYEAMGQVFVSCP